MQQYGIIMDAACDLTESMTQKWDIMVMPMSVTIGDKTFLHHPDGRGMDNAEFYSRLRGGETATTAAVSMGDWMDAIEVYCKSGKDVLLLPFSEGLSSTYHNAVMAAQEMKESYPDQNIYIVNTKTATLGGAILAQIAYENRRHGMPIAESWSMLEALVPKLCHYVTVDDLGHLRRGGRISAATAVVGGALGVKPLIQVDNEGKLVSIGKARGRKKAIQALIDSMQALIVSPQGQTVMVAHGDCKEEAEALAQEIKTNFSVKEVVTEYIGPVIGAHAGPGTLAIFFLGKHR